MENFIPPCFLAGGEIVTIPVDVVVARDKRIKVCFTDIIMVLYWKFGLIYRYTDSLLMRISQKLQKEKSWLVGTPFWRVVVLLSVKVCSCATCMCTLEHLAVTLSSNFWPLKTGGAWLHGSARGGCSGLNCIASICCVWVLAVIESLRWCCCLHYHYTEGGFAVYSSQQN